MSLTPEMRARMARDMLGNQKFDGDTFIPAACREFDKLAEMETVERPPVLGWPYKIYLFRAKNRTASCPVHINVHGGGWLIGHRLNDSLWSAWLADQIGGIVVDVDYTTTESASHPVAMKQVRDAVEYTAAHTEAWGGDPKRISIGGYSAGGSLLMGVAIELAMEGKNDPLCLLVDGYGPVDMRYDPKSKEVPEYWRTQEYRGVGFGVLLSDDDDAVMSDPTLYQLSAPQEALATLPPTLIISAATCSFRFQDEEMGKLLASLGVEVTMKRFPGTDHGFIPHFMPHWEEAGDLIVRAIKAASL